MYRHLRHDTYPISVFNDREIFKDMHFPMGISFDSFLRLVISFLNLFKKLLGLPMFILLLKVLSIYEIDKLIDFVLDIS